MKKIFPVLIIFILFGICFLRFGTLAKIQAAVTCPSSNMSCQQLSSQGGCANGCTQVQTGGGKSPTYCHCEVTTTATNLTCGSTCQNNEQCGTACPYCRASSPGNPTTCMAAQTAPGTTGGPIPAPTPIPCADPGRNPEFHSLRPYQASPCTVTPDNLAKFCGNDLVLHDTINNISYPGSENYLTGPGCVTTGGTVNCTYTVPVIKPVAIDLSGATLPFMGNTEDVLNSQSSTNSLSDADKMNNYVSWYLNGVMNRAENGNSENTASNAADFSGPLNKLLPGAIADAQRVQTINNVAANTNHNQIVACGNSNIPILGNLLKIGTFTPKECYAGDGSPATGDMIFRLNTWNGDLSFWNTGINALVNAISGFLPGLETVIRDSIGNHWNLRTPPLPWADENGKPFASEDLYTKAYNEWRGQTCVIIPFINKVVCFENILVPNTYADFYPYIPLSSTEDLKGSISIDSVSSATSPTISGVTVSGVTFSNQTPSTLFFPHMQEVSQLATSLQNTFVSKDQTNNETGNPTNVASSSSCSTVEVRSNKGDKLFATQLSGTLNYTANFTCAFETDTQMIQEGKCTLISTGKEKQYVCPTQSCTKDTYISLSTIGNIPKADDIWSQLVAGPESIFKRIFPKTNTMGSVGTIIDIPGSTSITYTGLGSTNVTQQSADLKFPHIGGIYEYFLKGIQTALRPKGYGDPIDFGQTSSSLGSVDCDQTAPDITLPKTISKQDLHNLAIQWEGGKTGDHVLECYNDVARKSLAAGISPAFTFFMWLHESGGSNYSISNQDWGINSSSVVGLTAQLNDFLELPAFYKSAYPQCFGKTRTDTQAYFDLFAVGLQIGQCVPGAGDTYTTMLNQGWSWLTTCPVTSYPFSSSCY
jgi:hypothetical protein